MNKNRLLSTVTAIFGMLTLVLAIIMMVTFPTKAELPEGYFTPIIAFEFATTPEEITYLASDSEDGVRNRRDMVAGLKWDMLFPFAYAGFLALIIFRRRASNRSAVFVAVPVTLMIIPFDVFENIVLLRILAAQESGLPLQAHLDTLQWATWLKWAVIGLSLSAIAHLSFKEAQFLSAGATSIAALCTCICWLSSTQPIWAEIMSLTVAISFIVLIVREVRQAYLG